jgi:hypothetical protein
MPSWRGFWQKLRSKVGYEYYDCDRSIMQEVGDTAGIIIDEWSAEINTVSMGSGSGSGSIDI